MDSFLLVRPTTKYTCTRRSRKFVRTPGTPGTTGRSYGEVMDKLGSLHAKLKIEAAKKASLREIAKQIGPDISDLKDAIDQLRSEQK